MTKPKQWTGREAQPKPRVGKATGRRRTAIEVPLDEVATLTQPVEPIPDEIEVQDEQTTIGST